MIYFYYHMITHNTMLQVLAICFKVTRMTFTRSDGRPTAELPSAIPKLVYPPSKLSFIQVHRNTGNVSIRKQTAHMRVKLAKHSIHELCR